MVTSKIYLAASYMRADEMRGCASVLQEVGYTVVSSWHANAAYRADATDVTLEELATAPEHCEQYALRDVGDLMHADLFIMFTGDGLSTGGRHTEFGMAMLFPNIQGIIIIGPRENVFQCYKSIVQFDTWKEFCHHMFNGLQIVDEKRGTKDALYVEDIIGDFKG